MPEISMADFARQLKDKRGALGVRAAAEDIGISAATLSRVERENLPDLNTFAKLCQWLEIDPASVLGLKEIQDDAVSVSAHFKKKNTLDPKLAKALTEMILKTHQAM